LRIHKPNHCWVTSYKTNSFMFPVNKTMNTYIIHVYIYYYKEYLCTFKISVVRRYTQCTHNKFVHNRLFCDIYNYRQPRFWSKNNLSTKCLYLRCGVFVWLFCIMSYSKLTLVKFSFTFGLYYLKGWLWWLHAVGL